MAWGQTTFLSGSASAHSHEVGKRGPTPIALGTILGACFLGAVGASAAYAQAQAYPSRPLRMVVPFPGGGPADQFARIIADRLSRGLGQPVVVFPKEGGGTIIGVDFAAKSAPDGYTMLLASDSAAINSASGRKLPYDLLRDLTPVSLVLRSRQVLIASNATPFMTVNELVAAAKANPGKIVYGTSGIGTAVHLSTERFRAVTGISLTHVPFKGVAPAMTEMLAGRIDMMILSLGFAGQQIASGKVRGLALADEKRYEAYPDLPTFRERGIEFTSYAWYGMLVPRGTPPVIVQRLADEIGNALADPEVRKRIAATAAEPMPMTPEKFAAFLKDDVARWQTVIKANNVKFD